MVEMSIKGYTQLNRILKEMAEFDDPDYKTEFSNVMHINHNTVTLKYVNGKAYRIERTKDVLMEAPVVTDLTTGERIGEKYAWSPAFTSVRWFMMLVAE